MPRREPRNYRAEYKSYHGKPEQIDRRAERNDARREAEKKGLVQKGDGKEVHHTNPSRKGSLGEKTRVVSRETNRRIGHPKRKG
jgi:hypothetical protein